MEKKKFTLVDGCGYLAEECIDGFLINPRLLPGSLPEGPFIIHTDHEYSVHCLIDGCLRCSGVFDNLEDALIHAKNKKV
jgi:hypothetical protein